MSPRHARRLLPGAAVAASVGMALSCLLAAPAMAAGSAGSAASAVPPAPTVTTPAGATATVPGLPSIPAGITNGVPAQTLLTQALGLSSGDAAAAPLEAQISQASAQLNADTVVATQADAAATAAQQAETKAQAAAAAAARSYHSLDGALRQATVRLYMTGPVNLPEVASRSANTLLYATAYEQTALTPQGVLARRRMDSTEETTELAKVKKEASEARTDAAQADAAVAAATTQRQQLTDELASLTTTDATELTAEHQTLASEAGQELTSSTALQFTPVTPLPAPVATTSVALDWAFSELGKTYVWGGTGPDVFDCSGLTQFVWGNAGVSIPRVAADQDAWTIPVPLSQLMPGDLVFFGTTGIEHVGIYIGDGLMINAPHTGTVVQVSSIWWSDLAGFGRVHAAGVPIPSHTLPSASAPAPPTVVPTAGAVPAQTAPPAGSDVQGSLPTPSTTPTSTSTTTTGGSTTGGSTTGGSTTGGTTTTTTAGGVTTSTAGGATTPTTVPNPSTTAPSSTAPSSPSSTNGPNPLGGLLGG
jgi:cell wall-associated NlpC family hydrolase